MNECAVQLREKEKSMNCYLNRKFKKQTNKTTNPHAHTKKNPQTNKTNLTNQTQKHHKALSNNLLKT